MSKQSIKSNKQTVKSSKPADAQISKKEVKKGDKQVKQYHITCQDIFDSVEKFGENGILSIFLDKEKWDEKLHKEPFRNTKQTDKNKNDVTYVPVQFNHVDGTARRLKCLFVKVVSGSKAKFAAKVDKNKAKHLNIGIQRITPEDIAGGDYVPREMETEEEQLIENKRVENNIQSYCENTEIFYKACLHLNNAYLAISEDLSTKTKKEVGFTVKKGQAIKISKIVQTTHRDEETEEEYEIESPMVWIKLFAGKKDRRIVTDFYNNDLNKYVEKPNVYDARKMKSNMKDLPLAKVKVGNKLMPLDLDNAGSFITYKSLLGGLVEFPEIMVHSFGISAVFKFNELSVRRHKSQAAEPIYSRKNLLELNDGEVTDDDSDEAVQEEEEENSGSDLGSGQESEEIEIKPKQKKKSLKEVKKSLPKKSVKKVEVSESDEETSDDSSE